jgi:hypothetical protein
MTEPEWVVPPSKSAGDILHGIVRTALSLKAGPLGELFAFVIRTPYERRMEDWIERCEMRFRHLAARDAQIIESLPRRDDFISVFISATQAAVRTHHEMKLQMLTSVVAHSAARIDLDVDLQLMFVRFVDELTPSHFALLTLLAKHEADLAELKSYEELRSLFLDLTGTQSSPAQFKLLCNDLEGRVLARFSEAIEDFGGIAFINSITTEDSGIGARVVVTDLGRSFLRFVEEGGHSPPSNTR